MPHSLCSRSPPPPPPPTAHSAPLRCSGDPFHPIPPSALTMLCTIPARTSATRPPRPNFPHPLRPSPLSLAFRHLASILSSQVSPSPIVGLCFLLTKSSCGSDLLLRNSKVLIAAGQGGLVFTQQWAPHALTVLVVSCFAFHSVWSCLSLFCRVPRACLSS